MPDHVSRKDFVALVATAVAAETLPPSQTVEAATTKKSPPAKPLGNAPEAFADPVDVVHRNAEPEQKTMPRRRLGTRGRAWPAL
jgi:hypothetical protein